MAMIFCRRHTELRSRCVFLLVLSTLVAPTRAVLPTAAIDVNSASGKKTTLFASQASFGSYPQESASNNHEMIPILPPEDDPLLCNESKGSADYSNAGPIPNNYYSFNDPSKYVMLVPRGSCTFERKALSAQRLGASAIVIYGSLGALYSVNETLAETSEDPMDYVIWPVNRHDYDCDIARSIVPRSSIVIPYDSQADDPLLSGTSFDGNLCAINNPSFTDQCESQRCLLTGAVSNDGGIEMMEGCCAWDLHLWLYSDTELVKSEAESVTIQAFFVTMKQGSMLIDEISNESGVKLTLYERPLPKYNFSSVIIWLMGTFVASVAAYLSGSEYREVSKKYAALMGRMRGNNAREEDRSQPRRVVDEQGNQEQTASDRLEITMTMAFFFVVMSSGTLLILFYFKIYGIVKALYAFGCAGALAQVLVFPAIEKIVFKTNSQSWWNAALCILPCDCGTLSRIEAFAGIICYSWCGYWLFLAFTLHHPSENTFFWITQDIMGAAMCILFIDLVRVPTLKIAGALLWALFVYDIFFVFISPLLFDSSVMITVATSGGPPTADPTWCEKYPDSDGCEGGDPLPMLLTFPRLGSYQGGASMLGLGDIVLPGLLLSFACRFDEAKRLVGFSGGGRGSGGSCTSWDSDGYCCSLRGYFVPVCIAYALGLMMANVAVYVMNTGQPALLYLVPMTFGTMYFLGKRRNELGDLWNGPKVLSAADEIVDSENGTPGAEFTLLGRRPSIDPSENTDASTRSVL
mmetsp:Transcript_24426/g.37691  ORF Transcript_24426/g.37691 Transcript_24426/m.37691 type:complete len:748 (-) Transcript_24426:534-2777(-)